MMSFAIPSFCWTFLYLVVGLWLTMRILALVLQFLIKRGTGILVKIGSVGLGSFYNVHIGIRKGLHVEIDKLWLSSCFVNDSISKPLVLCIGDIRIQADTNSQQKEKKKAEFTQTPPHNLPPKQFVLPKFAAYLQHFGLKINSLTVMLLKTMVPDCLIHVTGQQLGLDISCPEESFQMTVNVEGITCKALRSVPKDTSPGQASEPCLAEVSFSLYIDTSIYFRNIKHVKGLRILVSKPQMMLTEGLLTGIQKLQLNQSLDLRDSRQEPNTEKTKILELLPQELGIDLTEMDVKIVRETKQRSLSVGIKTFHVDLYNQRNDENTQEVACTVLLEDFSTKSPQATFAELVKLETKAMLYTDTLTVKSQLHGGYFHYHHEEVQYWVLVMSQLMMQREKSAEVSVLQSAEILTVQPHQNIFQETKRSNKAVEFLRDKQLVIDVDFSEVSSSVSTASCAGLLLGVTRTKLHITVKPGINACEDQSVLKSHDLSCELEIDTLYCHHCDIKTPVSELSGKRHYWNHVIYLGILMLKVKKLGEELRLEGMEDHLHIEWSTSTVNALLQIMSAMTKTNQRRSSEVQLKPVQQLNIQVPELSSASSSNLLQFNFSLLHIKFNLTNANVFTCNDHKVGLMLRLDSASVDHQYSNTAAVLEGCKVASITQDKQFFPIVRSTDIQKPVLSIREVRLNYKQSNKEANVQVVKEVSCEWTTAHHMCVIQILQDLKQLTSRLVKDSVSTDPALHPQRISIPVRKEGSFSISVNLIVGTPISLTLHLSSQHRVTVKAASFLMTMSPTVVLLEIDKLDIDCDQHRIFTFEGILSGTLPDSELKMERKTFKTLELATNRAWNVSFDLVSIVFPYDYNFALCFEEFVNFTKWLKLVHSVQRKPFTVNSKLPPDLQIKAKVFKVELGDDPFEVKLADNYELMKDEYSENEKRKSVLDQKVQNLKKGYTSIPAHKLEELYASFAQRMSEIYMQRSRKLYGDGPVCTNLFTWQMEGLEIVALADQSIHGKNNVVKAVREIDPDSPYLEEGLEFCTLWCRYVNVSLQSWMIQLRDYPQYMLDVKDLHVWGRLAAGEQEGAKRAKRTSTVEVAEPWGPMTVERNLPALKFYHDFSCDVLSWDMAYGACWEPVVAQYNLALDLVNQPSIDPSRPMPWWDKMRLLLHGRLTLSAEKMSWLYHASQDPYNTTELMDWSWSNLILDWTNGKFVLKGDLDIYARTASKYDDCRLLYLPGLTMTVKLEWLCLGDPNDHHAVMPCAPDKVPDYSHEEHDSFRAFRSQNMNLHLSLKTSPPTSADPGEFDQPSCLFYASTIRFLDKIKLCMMGVTRPTRRGALFENTKIRKPQLSRHYKLASLSVNFHQFDVCYWMSFSKQHGAELWGKSFVLEMCDELRLVPVEDGLFRRPNAEWSIKNLTCDLSALKFLLCSSKLSHEEELNVSSTGKPVSSNFCLSVSRVSYRRANPSAEANKGEKLEIPTHQVQVYELRGMWTKQNRTILLGLYDSYTKAQSLKRNLSSEALKGFKMEGGASSGRPRGSTIDLSTVESQATDTPSPLCRLQTSHAYSMLMKLVAESDSKSVAFTEEPSQSYMDQLHGVAACQTDDVLQKNWLIELHNSQIIVKGCETPGYVIVGAGKSQVLSCTHNPVWVRNQIRGKGTWVGSIECMQYYATVDPNCDFDDDDVPWLSREHVESRPEASLSGIKEMVGSGHSVGGVINTSIDSEGQLTYSSVQLQRIISRCKCQFFYADYSEIDTANLTEVPPPPSEDSDMMQREEGVDVFTLLHHDLNICTNSPQYETILDIVNNLLLYVEPKKKEATEKLQNMRFKLQLSRVEDQKTPILNLQESLRQQIQRLRYLERELYQISRTLEEESENESDFSNELMDEKDVIENKLKECKEKINSLNEELGIRISCFKENQLQLKSQLKMTQKAQQAQVVRRNEVCFKFAQWRLNETDGQIGLADLALRNFVYTKVNRDDDTWTHQLELGWVKVTNLLPNSYYKEVLGIRDNLFGGENDSRRVALRILCSEKAPVGGIAVKEHVEVNVVPVNIQITYQFYKTMMNFFFPGKNIENEEAEEETDGWAIKGTHKKLEKKNSSKEKKESIKRTASATAVDDIDKMKERAANNNMFVYVKIPEVSLRVSYKGEKEKNLEDVHEFNLVLPTIEYHNSIWTWFDLLMAMKNDSKRVLISQAIKQKLHMRSRAGEEGIVTDVQQEEDKAKMLLGAKLLAGQEKPAKKTLFGKSQK